jgi:Uma2 family endonuclease
MEALTLDLSEIGQLGDQQLFRLCASNRNIRIERTSKGELILMAPTGGETGWRNSDINAEVHNWNRRTGSGRTFDSSTGFRLPNTAVRSADVAWVRRERWEELSHEERESFPPLCPDFIIELRSKSDRLEVLRDKMLEWIANGCRLGWLIDPADETVYIDRANGEQSTVGSFDEKLSGEDVLPGFELKLAELR